MKSFKTITAADLRLGDRFRTRVGLGPEKRPVYTVIKAPYVVSGDTRITIPVSWSKADGSIFEDGTWDRYTLEPDYEIDLEVVYDEAAPTLEELQKENAKLKAINVKLDKRIRSYVALLSRDVTEVDLDTTTRVLQKLRDAMRNHQ